MLIYWDQLDGIFLFLSSLDRAIKDWPVIWNNDYLAKMKEKPEIITPALYFTQFWKNSELRPSPPPCFRKWTAMWY